MSFRTLSIDSAAEVHVRTGQLTIQRPEDAKPLQIDLDDLACIVFANLDITLSTGALDMISSHGITILSCGRNYMPTSIMLPFAKNSRYSEIVAKQLAMTAPFRKQLWKQLVKQKIENQAAVLNLANRPGADKLEKLAQSVRSGDPDNREALAAQLYFPLLKDGYVRSEVSPTSSILNYGYAIIRSAIARAAVSHGFISSVGLHHDNVRNEFNLVDDLIEPFRPIIDLQMLSIDLEGEDAASLSREARRAMTSVLRNACVIDGREMSCLIATEQVVLNLMRALEEHDAREFKLPNVLAIKKIG